MNLITKPIYHIYMVTKVSTPYQSVLFAFRFLKMTSLIILKVNIENKNEFRYSMYTYRN